MYPVVLTPHMDELASCVPPPLNEAFIGAVLREVVVNTTSRVATASTAHTWVSDALAFDATFLTALSAIVTSAAT